MELRISIITLGVRDLERSFAFYHHGLGFPSTRKPEQGIIFFQTQGVCLALYPQDKLAQDVSPDFPNERGPSSGITLAHNTRSKTEVDEIMQRAAAAGGKILKAPEIAEWGGYSGYFSDPDAYLWEVAWCADWRFHEDGSLVIE